MRSARGDVRAHIILHKNDHGPSYRPKADVGLGSSPVLAHPLTCVASLDVRWDRDAECEYCPIAARRWRSCDL